MFFTFSQSQHVLNLLLYFWRFSASCSYKKRFLLKKSVYQIVKTVFYRFSKHLEVRQKYSTARRIFNSLLSVWKYDGTLSLVFDILHRELDVGV